MRTHKRLIDILDPTSGTVDSLMRLDLPAWRRHRHQALSDIAHSLKGPAAVTVAGPFCFA